MPTVRQFLVLSLLCVAGVAQAQLTATIAVEPSSRKDSLTVATAVVETAMSKATGQSAKVTINEDLSDVMRATRTGEVDVYIGPPQVAALRCRAAMSSSAPRRRSSNSCWWPVASSPRWRH